MTLTELQRVGADRKMQNDLSHKCILLLLKALPAATVARYSGILCTAITIVLAVDTTRLLRTQRQQPKNEETKSSCFARLP